MHFTFSQLMSKGHRFYIRKTHRWLGLLLGIQFLIWTVSGLYFSWTNIDDIHGDLLHKHPPHLSAQYNLVSPTVVFANAGIRPDSIHAIQLVAVLGKPMYRMEYFSGGKFQHVLADATTGAVRPAVGKEEAVQIAAESFNGDPVVESVTYLNATGSHHEYREKPLPAWAVQFKHPTRTVVYVGALTGKVESFRNSKWRLFDFLWMGHTMDYQSRDNINNWLLRIFSLFGLMAVLSGFALWWVSGKWRR